MPSSRLPYLALFRLVGVFLVCLATVATFFRADILSHFTTVLNDRYDGIIEISILEHWYNVVRGFETWAAPTYFYPYANVLGYNDGYFIYGMIYAVFRFLRFDPFLAADLVSAVVKAIGFVSCYAVARRIFKIDYIFALFAAAIFTLSNNSFFQAVHAQLFSVAFVPVLILLADMSCRAFQQQRQMSLAIWGGLAVAFFNAWLMTAYYTAWFLIFYGLVFGLLYLVIAKPKCDGMPLRIRANGLALLVIFLIGVLTLIPFLVLYLPKLVETTSSHSASWSPALFDAFNIGPGNILFGSLYKTADGIVRPDNPYKDWSEYACGITPVLLGVFLVGLFTVGRKDRAPFKQALFILALTVVVSWLLTAHINGWHHQGKILRLGSWKYLHMVIPGAQAIRSISRYGLFLAFPITLFAVERLARWGQRSRSFGVIALLICCLLTAEQLNNELPSGKMSRTDEVARLAHLGPPPTGCRFFYASLGRDGDIAQPDMYSLNIDSMLISEYIHLPTVNGFASYNPKDWHFAEVTKSDYHDAVTKYLAIHQLHDVCALDLESLKWT